MSMVRARRRRRKISPVKMAAAVLLAVLLAAVGMYYVGRYREHMLYVQYPLRYKEQIVSCSREFGLEPWHVAAVIRCESSFRPDAVSSVGARGLMQIMPDTGEWLAGKFDEEDVYSDDLLFSPETNIKYGCWFLKWLTVRYGGDRTLVTAAYHAGHGTVDGWLEDPEISPDGRTLASIPYASTRHYLEKIERACGMYQELYDFSEGPGGA